MVRLITIIIFISSFFGLHGQSLNSPESIAIYSTSMFNRTVFISNSGNGTIVKSGFYDPNTITETFAYGLGSVRGLAIQDNTLFAACNAGLGVFDIPSGNLQQMINLPGAVFPNDVVVVDSFVFVSDSQANIIYKYVIGTDYADVFIDSGLQNPNGMCREPDTDNVLLVSFHTNSPIQRFNINNGTLQTVVTTSISNADGICIDEHNAIYISSWSTNSIYRLKSFTDTPYPIFTGLTSPADFYIFEFNRPDVGYSEHTLFIPLMNLSEIQKRSLPDFISYLEVCGGISEIPPYEYTGCVIHWEVAQELDTAGYDIYASSSPDSGLTLINPSIIEPINTSPAVYWSQSSEYYPYWWIKTRFANGNSYFFGPCNIIFVATSDDTEALLPAVKVYPNPVMSSSLVNYHLTKSSQVEIALYDLRGRLISKKQLGKQPAGDYSIAFSSLMDNHHLAKGMYLLRLQSNHTSSVRKLIKLD